MVSELVGAHVSLDEVMSLYATNIVGPFVGNIEALVGKRQGGLL